jgi:Group 4 capsule polysaccharide lipoprotein gfcB, YjbF
MPTMSFHRSAMRAAALVAALALSGCSSEGSGDWGAMFKLVRQSWERRDGAVKLDEAATIPYATLGLRVGDEAERIVVLGTDANGERLWTSSAKIALTTRDGRIVATSGLDRNLSAYTSDTAFKGEWKAARHLSWMADFADLGLYSVQIDCDDSPVGPEKISVLGQDIDTVRVDETCRSKQLDWSFTNVYWVSQTSNRVWRSDQYIHPKLDRVEIELLRPPQSAD